MEPRETRQVNRYRLTPEACADGPYKGYVGIDRINSAASKRTTDRFTHLMHHPNEFNLVQAFRQLDGAKAVGVDQVNKAEYGKSLQINIENLITRIDDGKWWPKPSREKLNRRSQKRSYTWKQFLQRLKFNPLPKPPRANALVDITNGLGIKLKHKPKSRVRENRTHGSERSSGRQRPLFT